MKPVLKQTESTVKLRLDRDQVIAMAKATFNLPDACRVYVGEDYEKGYNITTNSPLTIEWDEKNHEFIETLDQARSIGPQPKGE